MIREGVLWLSNEEFGSVLVAGAVLRKVSRSCRDFGMVMAARELERLLRNAAVSACVGSERVNVKRALEVLGPLEC